MQWVRRFPIIDCTGYDDCLNGGTCHVNRGTCLCGTWLPYCGRNCELLCLNGGTCVNTECNCPTGYSGPNCEYTGWNKLD